MASLETAFGEDAAVLRDTDFQVLLLANLMGPMAISLVSPLLSTLTGPFAVSEARIGLLVTVVAAPSAVLTVFIGALADRYGRKPVLTVALVLFGVGGLAIPLTTDFRAVLGLRLLQGIGYAGLTPIVVTSIGDLYSEAREATAQGLRFTGSGVAETIYPPVAGALVIVGWQYPFLLYGLALPIAAVVYAGFEEPVAVGSARGSSDGASREYVRALLRLSVHRRVLPILLVRAIPPFVYFGFLTYVSFLVRTFGGTPGEAGLLVSVGSVTFAVVATQVGRVTAMFDGRTVPLVAAHVFLAAGLTVEALAPSLAVAGVGMIALGLGIGVTVPLYRSVITEFAPDELRGGLMSVGESISRLAIAAAPIVIGLAIDALEPSAGPGGAIRGALLGVGIVGGVLAIVGLLISNAAPPVPDVAPE